MVNNGFATPKCAAAPRFSECHTVGENSRRQLEVWEDLTPLVLLWYSSFTTNVVRWPQGKRSRTPHLTVWSLVKLRDLVHEKTHATRGYNSCKCKVSNGISTKAWRRHILGPSTNMTLVDAISINFLWGDHSLRLYWGAAIQWLPLIQGQKSTYLLWVSIRARIQGFD